MQQRLQGIADVAQQLEPSRHLQGVRGGLSAGQRIGTGAMVTAALCDRGSNLRAQAGDDAIVTDL